MMSISQVVRNRDVTQHAKAVELAKRAIFSLRESGYGAWIIGSLSRGDFKQHSDIDILIECDDARRTKALRICLRELGVFPSSIVFKSDVPSETLPYFIMEAKNEPSILRH